MNCKKTIRKFKAIEIKKKFIVWSLLVFFITIMSLILNAGNYYNIIFILIFAGYAIRYLLMKYYNI